MPPSRAVVSWALYDLANTIFSFNILSFYFPVWLRDQPGARDLHLSIAFGASMVLVACASPLLGAASDLAGRRKPLLITTTLCCVTATVLLGLGGFTTALVLYAVANLFFQAGLVLYDAMLPDVAADDEVGKIGGAGIGIGYVGSFIGLGVGALLLHFVERPHPWIFAATGALFLLFAIPCFLWVREPERARRPLAESVRVAARGLRGTWRDLRANRPLARFLVARFIYADAANTLILFMGVYATRDVGFSETEAQLVLGAGIAAAIVGGFAFGRAVDRVGPKRVLGGVLFVWMGTFAGAALVGALDLPRATFWPVAAGAGLGLGGLWASDRPLMLLLAPRERIGEFYGIYGLVGRFAAVIGPLVWAIIVDGLRWGRPAAIAALLAAVVISWFVLRGVRVGGSGPPGEQPRRPRRPGPTQRE